MNKLTDERVEQIAAEYIAHNYHKCETLRACGYKETYCTRAGLKLFDNERVKDAVRRLQAKISLKTDITLGQQQEHAEELRVMAIEKGDLSTAARCIEIIIRTMGGFTDNLRTGDIGPTEPLTEEEQAQAIKIAQARLLAQAG